MPTATGRSRPPTAVALLERAIGYTRASLVLVTEADLERTTPCRGWRLRDLLGHLDDSLEAMTSAARAASLSLEPAEPPTASADLLESICQRARGLLGHWQAVRGGDLDVDEHRDIELAGLRLPRELLGAVGALEIALHGWDVAEAFGRPRSFPPELAMDLWPVARDHITAADRPFRFGPAVAVSDWATPATRLLALAGRSPRW
jgi:uncharacterized protein (TIGR03086 family)